jgi:glycerol-3-phosphate dehydrogenase (NAD(P)+)
MRITVLGSGAWGTSLACLLHQARHAITLWGHDPAQMDNIRRTGRNEPFLPGIAVPKEFTLTHDSAAAVARAELIVAALPSQVFRKVTACLRDFAGIVVSVTKGIEHDSGLSMCGILAETAPRARPVALSGPTFALEVARGIPTACVAASRNEAVARETQELFHRPMFRVYRSQDIEGVELGGALKNVIAIAAGVSDGLGFGDNSKAALVTRAIVEMRRLGVACGAQAETFAGLSGIGDLTVTCFSKLSRNRGFGERLGRGEKPADISASMVQVAEGVPTARSARALARKHGVETPIIDEVHAMLYEEKNARQALQDLLTRELKAEG